MSGFDSPAAGRDAPHVPGGSPTLSVIVPVFNQASSIVENIRTIRERIGAEFDEPFEVVVVSDGSIDSTEEELLSSGRPGEFRVFHYDRNLGKGFAVKLGALEATGDWIGFVDADLDLDPVALPTYLRIARERDLDFAIGSKRHPDSLVDYPRSRVVASWLFQQVIRLLFHLHVRDTQVGLKVFRREVAEQVLPFLLVKRYAFDLELLAVARAFGFDKVEELPIRLDYRFTGSGVRSRAVLRALLDTAAVFYRLRILRYYQRRRAFAGPYGWTRPREHHPRVSALVSPGAYFRERDYPNLELVDVSDLTDGSVREAAERATGEVLAILEPGARAAANWISATAPFFARPEVAVVVTPKIAPLAGPLLSRAASAVDESRLGGLVYFRYIPGNVRFVEEFPSASFLVRRAVFLALPSSLPLEEIPRAVAADGSRVLYTPESVIVAQPPPLFRPHLHHAYRHGVDRGHDLRRRRSAAVGARGVVTFLAIVGLGIIATLAVTRTIGRLEVVFGVGVTYLCVLAVLGVGAALRHRSLAVGLLATIGAMATHFVYAVGALSGLFRP